MSRLRLSAFLVSLTVCASAPTSAPACDVPVCRYAREHWVPDAYEVQVFHQGPLRPEDEAAVAALEQAGRRNLAVKVMDLSRPADETERHWCQSCQARELPWMVVRGPAAAAGEIWQGRLTADAVAGLTDSPARRETARRLLAGEAAVWLLLECGRREKDEAAATALRTQPGFGVVRVGRNDPAETLLADMLLSSEPDLRGRDEPMVFPVFGRGRVLYALIGAGINEANLRHAAAFLTGDCSCTVKRESPGVDLLLTADWGAPSATELDPEAPPTAGESVPLPPPLTPQPPAPVAPARAEPAPAGWSRLLLPGATGAAAILAVVTGWLALRPRKRTSSGSGPG
jgi:hypothetical protein